MPKIHGDVAESRLGLSQMRRTLHLPVPGTSVSVVIVVVVVVVVRG